MASLQNLQQNFRNTVSRQSQVFLLTEQVDTGGPSYTIVDVDKSNDVFTIDGDQTGNSEFAPGEVFYVVGSSGNDGLYTVDSRSLDGSGDTDVTVVEDVVDASTDGTVYIQKKFEWRNVGRVMDTGISMDVNASDPDQHGRESAGEIDVTFSMSMMQAANVSLAQIPNLEEPDTGGYGNYLHGHRLYLSGRASVSESEINSATDAQTSAITFGTGANELDDPQGIRFDDVLLKVTSELDLNGDESVISVEFTGEIYPDGSTNF